MIDIIDNDNHLLAECDSLENAIGALRTLVPEEKRDLRAVGPDGATLAVGSYSNLEHNDIARVVVESELVDGALEGRIELYAADPPFLQALEIE